MTSHRPEPHAGEPAAEPDLLSHDVVLAAWEADGADAAAALVWTRWQVETFRKLAATESGWEKITAAWAAGRGFDSWLATDWPSGFDELLLCAPLCRLVRFECARCTIGARQAGLSCAHPGTVFGRTAGYLAAGDRCGLLEHLDSVLRMLDPALACRWDLERARPMPMDSSSDAPFVPPAAD